MPISEIALINAGISVGLFSQEALTDARFAARQKRISVLEALSYAHRFPQAAFYHALAQSRGLMFIGSSMVEPDEQLIVSLPQGLMQRHLMVPVLYRGEVSLLVDNPDDTSGLAVIRQALGKTLDILVGEPDQVLSIVNRYAAGAAIARSAEVEIDAIGLLDGLLTEAWLRRASDLHIEPLERSLRVRMRVDGHMRELGKRYNHVQGSAIISRVKVLSGMDIAETRATQDGGFNYKLKKWDVPPMDLRAAVMPTSFGERITLRILGDSSNQLNLDALGMPPTMLADLRQALAKPYGIIFVTGPTGSGKSTTLYGALRELDSNSLNILTVEDPVEQLVVGLSQSPTSAKLSFADAVRAFLRHDPDIIMVGEVRDSDTADAAIKAAMTGHMVLSTLHTNHSVAAVTRLADIGCERFLLASNLIGVIAQRLVRKLCKHCRQARQATQEELSLLGADVKTEIYEPVGCASCLGSGYVGRVGIYEALWVDQELSEAIQSGVSERELISRANSLYTLRDDAISKVCAGTTSFNEVRYLL